MLPSTEFSLSILLITFAETWMTEAATSPSAPQNSRVSACKCLHQLALYGGIAAFQIFRHSESAGLWQDDTLQIIFERKSLMLRLTGRLEIG